MEKFKNGAIGIILIVVIVCVITLITFLLNIKAKPKKPPKIKLPSSKQLGEKTGKTVTNFGVGFLKGAFKAVTDKDKGDL